jgi:hypothetical protein
VSDPFEQDPSADAHHEGPIDEDDTPIDALPVLAGPPRILRSRSADGGLSRERRLPSAMIPAVQAAAVAAGGFFAGAAVLGLVHRHQQRSTALAQGRRAGRELGRRQGAGKRPAELLQIVGSRSLLVDVHLLGGADTDR